MAATTAMGINGDFTNLRSRNPAAFWLEVIPLTIYATSRQHIKEIFIDLPDFYIDIVSVVVCKVIGCIHLKYRRPLQPS
jgi:hypothetical protein